MTLTVLHWYVIAINVIAFLVYTIDFQIYNHGGFGIKPAVIINLVTICGGAFGAFIAELLWDGKIKKDNAQSRFYTLIWLFLQAAFFWAIWGAHHETVKGHVIAFYNEHKAICIYYLAINTITFIAFAIDKVKAMMGEWRVQEVVLLGLCYIGGGVGGFLAMDLCNHKVKTIHFMCYVPLMICTHLILTIFIAAGAI